MSTLSPMLAAWYASSPEHVSNNPTSDFINSGGGYPTGAVAAAQIRAAAVAAAAAAAVSSSGSLSSASPSLGNAVSSGLPSLSQAASLASSYPASMMSGLGYSERSYENQMGSHCQSNSYSAYQPPPSPYRPHPVSPPAHHPHHQSPYSSNHNSGQMHPPSVPYPSGHQLGLYGPSQTHYGASSMNNQDVYSGRSPIYGGGANTHMLKSQSPVTSTSPSPWNHSNHDNSSNEMLQGYPLSSRQSSGSSLHLTSPSSPMPPPPLRSPPVSMPTATSHFHRQLPISSSPSHSPHAWSQSGQIPSPGGAVLHSPRASPSPLPNHRSPGHTPFSPPPPSSTPSPHHHHVSSMAGVPPSPIGSHHSQQCPSKTPPSSTPPPVSMGSPAQSSSMVGGPSDPLQSLQKMVMLDSEMVSPEASAAVARGHYEMHPSHHSHTPSIPQPTSHHQGPQQHHHQHHHQQQHTNTAPPSTASRPSYFSSVETLAGNDPGSPYPTYYNLDQNRLCTPPRAAGSTPTSSTFTSAPDSASNSSVSVESYPNVTDSNHPTNGELTQHPQNCNPRDMDGNRIPIMEGETSSLMECRLPNGNSENMMNHYEMPCFMGKKKLLKGLRGGRRRSTSDDFNMPSPVDVGKGEHLPYGLPSMRKPYSPMDNMNGQMDYGQDERAPVIKKRGRGNRYPGPPRWTGRMLVEGEELSGGATAAEEVSGVCSLDEGGVYLSLALKRGQRKKRVVPCLGPGAPEGALDDPRYSDPNTTYSRSPRGRGLRSPRGGGGRRTRRRAGGNFNHFVNDRPHFDGGFLEVSGNATDGLTDSSFMVGEQGSREPPLLSPNMEEDSTPEGSSPFLKSGMLEAPRAGSQQELHFSPRSNHLVSPNGGECISGSSRTGEVYPHTGYQHRDQSSMDMSMAHNMPYQAQVPMERKRGRPRGSKNKPKLPGEETTPRKTPTQGANPKSTLPGPSAVKRPEENIDSDASSLKQKSKNRFAHGPLIRITGTRAKPLTVEVVNFAPADELKEASKNPKQAKRAAPAVASNPSSSTAIVRKRLGALGHTSTLSPLYDAFTRDRSWICMLCHNGSHHRGLGDLYGPYFLSEEQQKMAEAVALSTPTGPYSSGVPTPTSIPDPEETNKVWDVAPTLQASAPSNAAAMSPLSQSGIAGSGRLGRGKRKRSENSEDCLKKTLLKKAKQGKKSTNILGAGPSSSFSSVGEFAPIEPDGGSSTSGGPLGTLINESSSPGLSQIGEYWVHEDCTIWSQGVYVMRQQVRGLDDVVKVASDMICCKCKLNGATLGCWNKGCTEQYHFICAKDRGCEMDESNFSMLCPKHKRKSKIEIKQEECSVSISSTISSTTGGGAMAATLESNC